MSIREKNTQNDIKNEKYKYRYILITAKKNLLYSWLLSGCLSNRIFSPGLLDCIGYKDIYNVKNMNCKFHMMPGASFFICAVHEVENFRNGKTIIAFDLWLEFVFRSEWFELRGVSYLIFMWIVSGIKWPCQYKNLKIFKGVQERLIEIFKNE